MKIIRLVELGRRSFYLVEVKGVIYRLGLGIGIGEEKKMAIKRVCYGL